MSSTKLNSFLIKSNIEQGKDRSTNKTKCAIKIIHNHMQNCTRFCLHHAMRRTVNYENSYLIIKEVILHENFILLFDNNLYLSYERISEKLKEISFVVEYAGKHCSY